MAFLRHGKERPYHRFRYGPTHYLHHRRFEAHRHRRKPTAEAGWRKGPSPRKVALIAGGVAALVLVALVAVTAVNLERATRSMDQARSALASIDDHKNGLLSATGRSAARAELVAADQSAANAEADLRGTPLAGVLDHVPILGTQLRGATSLATDVHTATGVGLGLLDHVVALDKASSGTTVALPQLAALRSSVTSATTTLAGLEHPSGGLFTPLGGARQSFDQRVALIVTQLDRGGTMLGYLTGFLGGDGPRTYLLAAENQAEMRDQGAVLSVGQLSASGGHVNAGAPESVSRYPLAHPVDFPIPPGTQAVFGIDRPTQLWQSANLTADFPWTGGDLVAMYRQATGVTTDGVVGVDVHALAALLAYSGPVVVDGIPVPVTSSNAVSLLLDTLYRAHPTGSQTQRQDETAAVATAVVHKLSTERVDLSSLAHTLVREVAGRHLQLFDARPAQQAVVRSLGASGAVDVTDPSRTFHLAVESATAAKLDYFLTTSISQEVAVTPGGSASVITTVTVANGAPRGQAPSEQLGPDNVVTHTSGEYVGTAYLWAPAGSVQAAGTSESGLEVSSANLDLLPGQRTTLRFAAVIPGALVHHHLVLHWIPQPTIRPQRLSITVSGVGSLARGATTTTALLSAPITDSWTFPG